jgi:hypothetical protein
VERLAGIGRGAAVEAGGVGEALSESDVTEDPQGSHVHKASCIPKNEIPVKS